MKLLDVVKIKNDVPSQGLKAGDRVVLLERYTFEGKKFCVVEPVELGPDDELQRAVPLEDLEEE